MPKGQSHKLKETLCNAPIETINAKCLLSRQADANWLVVVKVKEKSEYRSWVYYEPVHSRFIVRMLEYWKHNQEL